MSGGAFDYEQNRIRDAAQDVDHMIQSGQYSPAIEEQMRKAVDHLRLGAIYLQRIDWLVSGDDGVETFFRRLSQELKQYHEGNDNG